MGTFSTSPKPAAPAWIPPFAWGRIGVLGVLFVAYHAFVLQYLAKLAWEDPNWSHAFLVPLISLYFIHQRLDELRAIPPCCCWWGLPVMIAGMVLYALGIYPLGNQMAMGYAMILTLFGLIWLMTGTAMMRILWLPVCYLFFAIKISYQVWEPVAWQLQNVSAGLATILITALGLPLGIEAEVTGTAIHVYYQGSLIEPALNVAEACSGLRMLMTLVTLGVAVAFLGARPWWARLVLVALTVPIAVLVNAGRVMTIGFLYPFNRQMSTGDFHLFVGMLMLLPALALMMLASWFLGKLVTPVGAPAAGGRTA
ncbi:MAG: exosortase [Lentisphaeria bacterium]